MRAATVAITGARAGARAVSCPLHWTPRGYLEATAAGAMAASMVSCPLHWTPRERLEATAAATRVGGRT